MKIFFAKRLPLTFILIFFVSLAQAHPGHLGAQSFLDGIYHPLSFDHMLAILAVGAWSYFALPVQRMFIGPSLFILFMLIGAILSRNTVWSPHFVEMGVSISLPMLGLLVCAPVLLGKNRTSNLAGFFILAISALIHGAAHGMDLSLSAHFSEYLLGFVLTTSFLHALGLFGALLLSRILSARSAATLMGSIFTVAGLFMLGQFA